MKNKSHLLIASAIGITTACAQINEPNDGYIPLFNGSNFDNWYTFLDGVGIDSDPDGLIKIQDSEIQILTDQVHESYQPFGYFGTTNDHRNYRLRFEYRWGVKKFAPRENKLRDSGFLYHTVGEDKIWPTCLESQVQEGDTGDFIPLSGARMDTTINSNINSLTYLKGGTDRLNSSSFIRHSEANDSLTNWNVCEVIVSEADGIHIVNGLTNYRGYNATFQNQPLTEGRILFQVEGAEVFYRNIEIKPLAMTGGGPDYDVLVFTKTAGFVHGNIPDGLAAIQMLASQNNFSVDTTADSSFFTAENLEKYECVVFLSTTGDILNDEQQAIFEDYIQSGGGFVGIHAASDAEYDWEWYGDLVGAYFDGHPAPQFAEVNLHDTAHPSTSSMGTNITRFDEWYDFAPNPANNPNIRILASVDESTYNGGGMGASHPMSWCQEYDGGRSWYTGMGDKSESFAEPQFLMHLLGGIEWAAGQSSEATSEHTVLFDGSNTSSWKTENNNPVSWINDGNALEVIPGSGNIQTVNTFEDFRLHLEFRPNSTNAADPQDRADSGVLLQGRYELQILDSYGMTLTGLDDCGAIYGVKDADSQQAWPSDAWQHYDIWFRAARWDGDTKIENARVTVYWNGELIHDNVELLENTQGAAAEAPTEGPLVLEDGGNAVSFRNIWIDSSGTAGIPPSGSVDDLFTTQDIGSVNIAGGTIKLSDTSYSITASGNDIWNAQDQFHFAHTSIAGDFSMTAQVTSIEATNIWAKAGVMARASLDADAANLATLVTSDRGVSAQQRIATGSSTTITERNPNSSAPIWVRLERTGNAFVSSESLDGENFTTIASWTSDLPNEVFVGLAVTSHNNNALNTAVFENVELVHVSDVNVTFDAAGFDAESHPNNANIVRDESGNNIGFIKNNSWAAYYGFNFGGNYLQSFDFEISSASNGGTLEVRIGSPTGALLGTVDIPNTGGWSSYQNFTMDVSQPVFGIQDLYFVFSGGNDFLYNIATFRANASEESVDLGVQIDAVDYDTESHPNDNGVVLNQIVNVGHIDNDSWIRFDDFNLGNGATAAVINASSGGKGGMIEIRVDSPTGTLLGAVPINNTGSWANILVFESTLPNLVTGVHDLYLVFTGNGTDLFDLQSFQLD